MLQTPDLLPSCCKILLNTISALLLAENVLLPDSLTKEAIEKVTKTSYWRNTRLQVPYSSLISGYSISGWAVDYNVLFSFFALKRERLPST